MDQVVQGQARPCLGPVLLITVGFDSSTARLCLYLSKQKRQSKFSSGTGNTAHSQFESL